MGLRICLVTPFAWSQPHDVNEHVAGVAGELRALGHTVIDSEEVIALGPAVPISRRSRIGVPVGARTNLSLALVLGRFDIVHGFEPGLPSLSYLALRDAQAMTVATFLNAERLGYPPGRAQRDRLLGRIDALVATSEETAEAAAVRFPGQYRVVSEGIDATLFVPGSKRNLIVLEWRPNERALLRGVFRALEELPDWELVLLRTKPLAGRPTIPRILRHRVHVRTARDGAARAPLLAETSIFVPALAGLERVRLEASTSGCAIASPPGVHDQPELAGAEAARLAEDPEFRARKAARAIADAGGQSFADVARELDELYRSLSERRHAPQRSNDPLADRPWVLCDLHMHTSWSADCAVDAADLIMHATAIGLGAIAVTDHNVFVLREEIPRGLSFADTVTAIKEQDGLVYLPHPFDRMHSIPDPATLQHHLADIDIFEVYNARLLFEAYNDEALRFARKYNLTMGAGSDAHVLQGVGTGAVRMRAFEGSEEFLLSLRSAQVLRRPRSLVYLQSLKWMAQAKERVR